MPKQLRPVPRYEPDATTIWDLTRSTLSTWAADLRKGAQRIVSANHLHFQSHTLIAHFVSPY
jgi:hypothetical protein